MPATSVLVVTRNLPPLTGGIERLMQHAVAMLCDRYTCDVIGPTGCGIHVLAARQVWELRPDLPWFHLLALPRITAARDYGLVVAGNGLVAPLARIAARRNRCPYAVFVHGLDLVVDRVAYQRLFLPSIRAANTVIANSRHTAGLARQRGVSVERIQIINPGVEPPTAPADGAAFRARHGLRDRPLLLTVGRLVPRKGIAEFVERALSAILKEFSEACLVVIGEEPSHAALRTTGTRAVVEAAITRAGAAPAVLLTGRISDEELAQAYAAADVFVFPVLDLPGDVEGFGMVAMEAASHGVPTVAFSVGGVADAVSQRNGLLIEPGNYDGFAEAVARILMRRVPGLDGNSCRQHAADNDWNRFGRRLIGISNQLMLDRGSRGTDD